MAPIAHTIINLCIPVLLSVLKHSDPSSSSDTLLTQPEVMSLYVPQQYKHCNYISKNVICYDAVVQNFVRCNGNVWEKVTEYETVPVIVPHRDSIAQLSDKIHSLEQKLSSQENKWRKDVNDVLNAVSDPKCPAGWSMDRFNCYQSQGQTTKTWRDAQAHCEARGANLVTIKNESDMKIPREFYPLSPLWIGLSRPGTYKEFHWSDAITPFVYNNWRVGEPSVAADDTDQNCVVLSGSDLTWDNTSCEQNKVFVCQKLCCGLETNPV